MVVPTHNTGFGYSGSNTELDMLVPKLSVILETETSEYTNSPLYTTHVYSSPHMLGNGIGLSDCQVLSSQFITENSFYLGTDQIS